MTPAGAALAWTELWPDSASSPEWSHSGAAVLGDGRLLFAAPGGHALIALDESSGDWARFETPTEDCHGLTVSSVAGREIVWIADPGDDRGGRVIRLDWTTMSMVVLPDPFGDDPHRQALGPWRPTSTAVVEAAEEHYGELWVADGYGRSLVHRYGVDGSILTLDGRDTGTVFDCPHGIAVDTRGPEPQIVVADRLNSRLVFLDLDGRFVREVTSSTVIGSAPMARPSSLAVRSDRILVTDLIGALLEVDLDDRIDTILPAVVDSSRPGWPNIVDDGEIVRPVLVAGELNSPHGIAVGGAGQVYLTEWLLGGRQLRLDL
ncbi:MAG: repeat-containing protein [Frondihabitans sp.]|nr:repeat-containing protein [Frondihabitans sp.]